MRSKISLWSRGPTPRAALVCGFVACLLPLMLGVALSLVAGPGVGAGIFGVVLASVAMMAVGVVVGWAPLLAAAMVLYAIAALEFTAGLGPAMRAILLAVTGTVLFLSFGFAELSFTLRRSARVSLNFWAGAMQTMTVVPVIATVLAVVAATVAATMTWPALVLPTAVLGLGIMLKVAANQLPR